MQLSWCTDLAQLALHALSRPERLHVGTTPSSAYEPPMEPSNALTSSGVPKRLRRELVSRHIQWDAYAAVRTAGLLAEVGPDRVPAVWFSAASITVESRRKVGR
ncbi:hypothetical protein GCM10027068_39930 [Prescottella soli]